MKPEDQIDPIEARVLGVLVEKQLTTPDSYPLSLNSTTVGCNQKSNRDPVTELLDGEVHQALSKLIIKGYAGLVTTAGSRVEKYRHNVRERLSLLHDVQGQLQTRFKDGVYLVRIEVPV